MAVLIQVTLLALGIACVCGTNVEEYLKQHAELSRSSPTDEHQVTQWDRSSMDEARDLTYPVEGHQVPEVRVQLFGERKKQRKRPRTRARRQISPESCHLLFANRQHVIQMQNVPSFRIRLAYTGLLNAVAVDFDKRDGCIFWSDVALAQIYQLCGDSDTPTILVDTNITTPDGIAYDWVSKNIYWTDMGDQDLEVYDPFTGRRKVLFKFGDTSKPRAIVVDPSTGYMYWSDWGGSPAIIRASMDGSNSTILHNTNLWWPNGLTIDYEDQKLFWIDAAFDRLETSNTDGSKRMILLDTNIYHPFSLTFLPGVGLFWSDWELNAVLAAPLSNFSSVGIVFGDLTLDPMGVTVSCAVRQANVSSPCDGRCDGKLCLLSSSKPQGYSCFCSEQTSGEISGDVNLVCERPCGANGVCTGRNYCRCNAGWRGSTCDKGLCTEVCMHGDCTGPDTCTCDDGWEGESCDLKTGFCCEECIHGTCTSPGQCICQSGWEGVLCDQRAADPCKVSGGCENGGSCKTDVCDCPLQYGGVRCEKDCRFQNCP